MTKKTKAWSIAALICILAGVILFCSVMFSLEWDLSALSTYKYVDSTYTYNTAVNNINIMVSTADVELVVCNDEKVTVTCHEQEYKKHNVLLKDGELTITNQDKKWYQNFGISFETTKITIRLPEKVYESVFVKGSTGDVVAKNLSANNLGINISTGDITLENVNCEEKLSARVSTGKVMATDCVCFEFVSQGNTGDAVLENVIAKDCISILRSTGDVTLNFCDSDRLIFVGTDTGDIRGELLSKMNYIAHTDTGRIQVPESNLDGRCELTTNTGDIIFN